MKKRYEKPAMKVVLLKGTQMLATSNPDYWGYAPGTGKEGKERNLA